MSGSLKWSLSLRFSHKNSVCSSLLYALILLDLITRTILGEEYRLLSKKERTRTKKILSCGVRRHSVCYKFSTILFPIKTPILKIETNWFFWSVVKFLPWLGYPLSMFLRNVCKYIPSYAVARTWR
jgi:hypothetical protein